MTQPDPEKVREALHNLEYGTDSPRAVCEWVVKYEPVVKELFRSWLSAQDSGMVAIPREPDDEYVEKICFKAGVCGGIFESVHSAMIACAAKDDGGL